MDSKIRPGNREYLVPSLFARWYHEKASQFLDPRVFDNFVCEYLDAVEECNDPTVWFWYGFTQAIPLMEKDVLMQLQFMTLVARGLSQRVTPPTIKNHQCSRFIGDGSDGGCENWEKCGPELKETLEKIKKTVQESELYKDFQDSGSRRMPISVIDAIETLLNPSKGKLITESKATWVNGRALAPHDEY